MITNVINRLFNNLTRLSICHTGLHPKRPVKTQPASRIEKAGDLDSQQDKLND